MCCYLKERAVDPSKEEGGEDAENGGDDDEGPSPVVKLTNANFNEVVNESPEKDIMIKFYAPWCGHCKALKPEYEDLADAFAGVSQSSLVNFLHETIIILTLIL